MPRPIKYGGASSIAEAVEGTTDSDKVVDLDKAPQVKESKLSKTHHSEYTTSDGVPVPLPEEVDTAEKAQQWAEAQIIKATPRAVQEMIYQLRRGDVKNRGLMAMQILDRAAEQSKRGTHQGPVIILTPAVVAEVPWLKKAEAKGQIVEGELVKGAIVDATKDRT